MFRRTACQYLLLACFAGSFGPDALRAGDPTAPRPLPAPPPLPPTPPPRQFRSPNPGTAGVPGPTNRIATVLVGTNQVRVLPPAALAPGTLPGGSVRAAPALRPVPLTATPFVDPTYIPGLVPLPTVGPPIPMAPIQPAPYLPTPYHAPAEEKVFAYDALVKEATLKPGETSAPFTFTLTNTSAAEVTINAVRTSCGCTVAKLPSIPWKLGPGANGTFDVKVDVTGKSGILTKTITVDSTAGYRYLSVRVSVPAPAGTMNLADRGRNLQVALADRQAVFKGDCAACHLQPAVGKRGQALFRDACGVCHEAEHRASMVPNLRALNKPVDAEYWRNWIAKGKVGTLMPAWAVSEGGPLNSDQIESLVEYLNGPFKAQPFQARGPAPALPGSVLPPVAGGAAAAGPAAGRAPLD
jgi:mono/diheme cytochrome c family protein